MNLLNFATFLPLSKPHSSTSHCVIRAPLRPCASYSETRNTTNSDSKRSHVNNTLPIDGLSYPVEALEWRPDTSTTQGNQNNDSSTQTARIPNSFIDTFRMSSPYIHAYHGLTFVIHVPGALVREKLFASVLMDIALMRAIGIKPVLVLGPSLQTEERLHTKRIDLPYVDGIPVTDARALQIVKEAAGSMRFEVEGILARGMVNMPLSTRVSVVSGSFYSARPVGVLNGTDYGFTGRVRRIDAEGINRRLDSGDIIVLPNVGFSPSGQLFNCQSEEVAGECAKQLSAEKLIFLAADHSLIDKRSGHSVSNLTLDNAVNFLDMHRTKVPYEFRRVLEQSVFALQHGVKRTHIVNRFVNGVLLMELFHRDGVGLMISGDIYEGIRPAVASDVLGMMEIIKPLTEAGILKTRDRATIENEISDYTVIERDGAIIGCLSLRFVDDEPTWAELGCFVVHNSYRKLGKGDAMMSYVERKALALGVRNLFILSTQSWHFFMDKGFKEIAVHELPQARRESYDFDRRPKIFRKVIEKSKARFDDALRVQVVADELENINGR